jgi:hypothetical protein
VSESANVEPVKVLYVLGSSRSGSTVLANLLGESAGFFSAGELRFLWERAAEGRLCGCGDPVAECSIWSKVLADQARLFAVSREAMIAFDHGRLRLPRIPSILRAPPADDADLRRYVGSLAVSIRSLAEHTGARVIVDSSKRPSNGAVLRWAPGIDVRYLHLVRDARAVAHSRLRRKLNPDRETESYIGGSSVWNSSVHWCASNAAADLVRRASGPARSLLIRYEDFVQNPTRTLARIGELVGEDVDQSALGAGSGMRLTANHSVSGNPDRFITGTVPLRLDQRWKTTMSFADRVKAEMFCAPLLLRYRYPIHPPKTPAA